MSLLQRLVNYSTYLPFFQLNNTLLCRTLHFLVVYADDLKYILYGATLHKVYEHICSKNRTATTNFTNSLRSLIIFGTDRPYSILHWLW